MTMQIREPLPTNPEGMTDRERIVRVETRVDRLEHDIHTIARSVPSQYEKYGAVLLTFLLSALAAWLARQGVEVSVPPVP